MNKSQKGISIRTALTGGYALAQARLFGRARPLFAEWNLTFRCNLRCKYCGASEATSEELPTTQVLSGLDDLWALGCRWITFGGGEPLLRRDTPQILQYAKEKGFQVFISTNGYFVSRHTQAIQDWVDHVNLSLDGGRDIHDAVRGKGAYDKVLEAIEVCARIGVSVSLQCVLSSNNLDCVDEAIEVAERYHVPIMFQPATQWKDSSTSDNPIAPEPDAYRRAIAHVVKRKKEGAPVRNSLVGLAHLAHWPNSTPIACTAGLLTCTIEPDGTLLACHQCEVGGFLKGNTHKESLKEQYNTLARPKPCRQCWCAPVVELALLFSMRPGALWNAIRMFL